MIHTENNLVDPEHKKMLESVKQIASEKDYTYGSRRIKKAMNILAFSISRSQGRKLMREARLNHHPDHGSQYASKSFRRLLKANEFKGSMSRKGYCWAQPAPQSALGTMQ